MIPAAFEYHRPGDIAGALALLEAHGDEARVVAGGHSLIPMMKLRMTDIAHLIDLGGVAGLRDIEIAAGRVRLGAMVTQARIAADAGLAAAAPILRETALQIADPQVRNLGTIGGNVANGDPGNDMPAVMLALDATFTLVGPDGERRTPARGFYEAAYMTARDDSEILTAVEFAVPAGGWAYQKQKRKIGDYATAAAAVQVVMEGGLCAAATIAMTNLSDVPVLSSGAAAALVGTPADEGAIRLAARAMQEDIAPMDDNRGPAAFKRHAASVVLSRAIARARACA